MPQNTDAERAAKKVSSINPACNETSPPDPPTNVSLKAPSLTKTIPSSNHSPPRSSLSHPSPSLPSRPMSPSHSITSSISPSALSPTSPSSPLRLRETCFFWYHTGSCRRSPCPFAHEVHITWPIIAPPGYVHLTPCQLPLCPLKEGMPELRKERSARGERRMGEDRGRGRGKKKRDREAMPKNPVPDKNAAAADPHHTISDTRRNLHSRAGSETRKPTTTPKSPSSFRKLCFFWYHAGKCIPTRSRQCPYFHFFEPGVEEVTKPRRSVAEVRRHAEGCELELCPFRSRRVGGGSGGMSREARGLDDRDNGVGCVDGLMGQVTVAQIKARTAIEVEEGGIGEAADKDLEERREDVRAKTKGWRQGRRDRKQEEKIFGLLPKSSGTEASSSASVLTDSLRWRKRKREDEDGKGRPLISLHGRKEESPDIEEYGENESGSDKEDAGGWWLDGFPDAKPSSGKVLGPEMAEGVERRSTYDDAKRKDEFRADWDTDYLRRAFGEIGN